MALKSLNSSIIFPLVLSCVFYVAYKEKAVVNNLENSWGWQIR